MQRFFLPGQPLLVGSTIGLDSIAHQLQHVLRLAVDDEIILLDGAGQEAVARITTLARNHAACTILAVTVCRTEPQLQLTLYQCSLKHDKFEWLLQKATELGVTRIVPVVSARSVVRPTDALHKKYDRWRAVIREAAEQSGRGRLPILEDACDWQAAVRSRHGAGFVPWEQSQHAPGLGAALSAALVHTPAAVLDPTQPMPLASPALSTVSLLIGPEGGITPDEITQACAAGWQPVTLGPRILRAETAALTALTIALDRAGELS